MQSVYVSLILFFSVLGGFAQTSSHIHKCSQQQHSDSIRKAHPEINELINQNEQELQQWLKYTSQYPQVQSVITIPVVFHVLYANEDQNLPDDQIMAQLDVLNRDFRRQNADTILTPQRFKSISADTEIEFCLATQKPDGQPTNGIIRQQTDIPNIGNTNKYYRPTQGGSQIWDPRYYLNIWVCEITDTLLGFTYLPGEAQPNYDGVVLNYKVCGDKSYIPAPFNMGRTLVHEIGHWLNLQHVWGPQDGCQYDDGIADTPPQEKSNSKCPNTVVLSCNNGPNGDMWVNYMDYTYDQCQTAFTYGQKNRMLGTLNTSRKLLPSSQGCAPPDTTQPFVESLKVYPNPVREVLNIDFNLSNQQTTTVYIYDITGRLIMSSTELMDIGTSFIDVSHLNSGCYIASISTSNLNQKIKFIKTDI
ncbi:T9SS type A sorting domain-containing protein [bacterium SCSIO 12643]|nr:T9SS type A sorting domain-containing protein [bacterium SCSIO 12643]